MYAPIANNCVYTTVLDQLIRGAKLHIVILRAQIIPRITAIFDAG